MEIAAAFGVTLERFLFEVTEAPFQAEQLSMVTAQLATLRGAGTIMALDGFGTGYASLSHLRRLPIDIIKIDRSFITDTRVTVRPC